MIFDRKAFSDRVYDALDSCTFTTLNRKTRDYVSKYVERCAHQIDEELNRRYVNERVSLLKFNIENGILKKDNLTTEEETLLNIHVGYDWKKKLVNE